MNTNLKEEATKYILETSKQLILSHFNENNNYDCVINIENDRDVVEIHRNCFPNCEDYTVYFKTTIQKQPVKTRFYLEWNDNDLIPGHTTWNTKSGKLSDRVIKIVKC